MNGKDVRMLIDYHYWATQRIVQQASAVAPEAYATAALGYCKLHETLVHLLNTDWSWRMRWQGTSPAAMLDARDFVNLQAIRDRWDEEQAHMYRFLATLDDAMLDQPVSYRTFNGTPYSTILWPMLVHLVTHGTQHRSELAMLLTELGHSPGSIDLITFVREQA